MAVDVGLNTVGAVAMDIPTGNLEADIPLTRTPSLGLEIAEAKLVQGPKGDKGEKGESAYESAIKGGYAGTENEFYAELASFAEYAEDSKGAALRAETARNAAETSASEAKDSETAAKASADSASQSATQAASSAGSASGSASAADDSAKSSANSASWAAASASSASESARIARNSEINAKVSESAAATSEANAKASETAAGKSESAAKSAQAAAEEAIGKNAYIGDNGNWWQWDAMRGAFVDSGIAATSIGDENSGERVRMWFGTIAEYNALPVVESDVLYHILEGRVVV